MRQTIIWTNNGKLTDAYMRHSASMPELNVSFAKLLSKEIYSYL